jgi:condensation domain-containing protein
VVERQEVLRLSFLPGKERPVQMIRRNAELSLRYRTLANRQTRDEAVEEIATEIFSKPLDLVRGPLYRAEVLQRGPDDHVMVFAIHHAIADGWSLGVFVRDLCAAYVLGIFSPDERLPDLPLTYTGWGVAEHSFWQQAELQRRAAFWKSTLAGRPRLWSGSEGPLTASGPSLQMRSTGTAERLNSWPHSSANSPLCLPASSNPICIANPEAVMLHFGAIASA